MGAVLAWRGRDRDAGGKGMKRPPLTDEQRMAEFDNVRADYALKGPEAGTRWTDPLQANAIFELIIRWLETGDPAFMDHALIYCFDHELPIQPVLFAHLADAAKERKKRGNAELPRPERETAKAKAFQIMANLMARGIQKAHASEIAASWMNKNGGKQLKASSLDIEYNGTGWPQIEARIKLMRLEAPDTETDQRWLTFARNSKPIEDEIRGERR